MYIEIPTWEAGIWSVTNFQTMEEYRDFVLSLFKEPGKYDFDSTSYIFNEQANKFRQDGIYCVYPEGSRDFRTYWNDQKNKCRVGVIFKNNGNVWYLPRDYYMWINFLQINNKVKKKFDFPTIMDAQYHMALYELIAELHWLHSAILKKRQIASEQPHSEPVLGKYGWTTMGNIQPGDEIWNPDGTLTTILHKSNNGISDVYEFEFIDGRKTKCGIDHNWEVYDRDAKKYKVLTTKLLLRSGLLSTPIKGLKRNYNNYRYSINLTCSIPGIKRVLPVDPYVLGALLGDGHINNRSVYISGKDDQIFDEISYILGDTFLLKDGGYCKKNITFKKRFSEECKKYYNGQYGCNPLLRELHKLGLGSKGKNTKFIPDSYLDCSIQDRISMLQGLMDTDGYVNSKGNNINFTNTNYKLIEQVVYISRSLGLKCHIVNKCDKATNSIFYRVLFSGKIPFELFRLDRKKIRLKLRENNDTFNRVPIINISKCSYQEESSCIVVDNPNHLYITRDFIVTHNSYYHCAKLINQIWFEETPILKMGASLKDYINEKGSWKFLNEYESFLNKNTAWYRPMNPGKVLMWQQQIEDYDSQGRPYMNGLKGTLQGVTFDKDATSGVGGAIRYFFYEEAGIAPTMDTTVEFLLPALQMGDITTGMFIAAGSVGELDQCEPLKHMILYPRVNSIYPVTSNLLDEKGTVGESGLFIPEQWSMDPYIDNFGNSLVEKALDALNLKFAIWKKDLSPEKYQLRISQHPRNIAEAFAYRKVSLFPQNLVGAQKRRIEEKEYPYEHLELERNLKGEIEAKVTRKLPISEFPITKNLEDKSGCLVVYERPDPKAEWGTYYGSINPVSEGKTTTSESLCSIYIYKNPVEVTRIDGDKVETFVEQDKIVASWCGRFDDINKTHERLELIIEWYNAWTIIENNISLFIVHMINKKKQRYLVPKNQILFLKDLGANNNVYQDYGWKNTGTLFKGHLLSYLIEFLKEVLDTETKEDGTIVKVKHGIERIPDLMAMKEMEAYNDDINVDRIVALAALIAFAKVQQANRGYKKRLETTDKKYLAKNKELFKLVSSPFRHMGGTSFAGGKRPPRSPFKNMR